MLRRFRGESPSTVNVEHAPVAKRLHVFFVVEDNLKASCLAFCNRLRSCGATFLTLVEAENAASNKN